MNCKRVGGGESVRLGLHPYNRRLLKLVASSSKIRTNIRSTKVVETPCYLVCAFSHHLVVLDGVVSEASD